MALKNTDDKTNAHAKSKEAPVVHKKLKVSIKEALENLEEVGSDKSNDNSPQPQGRHLRSRDFGLG